MKLLVALALAWPTLLAAESTVIWNVSIVIPSTKTVEPSMAVETDGDRIVRVWSIHGASRPKGSRLVDGRGGYLMPGLWDSHVHLTKAGARSLPLFLAFGITSVRDMGSDLGEVLEWRAEIEAGERIGPRIKTPGQIMESAENVERMLREQTVEPVERIRFPLSGPDDALPAVRRLAEGGADFIKIRTIPNEPTLRALSEAARKFGLKLTGHPVAEPQVLAEVGMGSVDHFLRLNPIDSAEQRQNDYRQILAAGVRIGTTTVDLDNSVLLSYEEIRKRLRRDPRMRFVGDYLRRDWEEQASESKGAEAEEANPFAGRSRICIEICGRRARSESSSWLEATLPCCSCIRGQACTESWRTSCATLE